MEVLHRIFSPKTEKKSCQGRNTKGIWHVKALSSSFHYRTSDHRLQIIALAVIMLLLLTSANSQHI